MSEMQTACERKALRVRAANQRDGDGTKGCGQEREYSISSACLESFLFFLRLWECERPCLAGYRERRARGGAASCAVSVSLGNFHSPVPGSSSADYSLTDFASILDDPLGNSCNQACACGQFIGKIVPGTRLFQTQTASLSLLVNPHAESIRFARKHGIRPGGVNALHFFSGCSCSSSPRTDSLLSDHTRVLGDLVLLCSSDIVGCSRSQVL